VIDSKGAPKEKGRALKVTRPKPTIYGNCDSWNFIVGKKPRAYSPRSPSARALQASNSHLIHSFSTNMVEDSWNKLWAICGCGRPAARPSRIVVALPADMPQWTRLKLEFYRKTSLGRVAS